MNVTKQDSYGDSPLHCAVDQEKEHMVELIIESQDCNPRLPNREKYNALHLAAVRRNDRYLRLTIRKSYLRKNLVQEFGRTRTSSVIPNGKQCFFAQVILNSTKYFPFLSKFTTFQASFIQMKCFATLAISCKLCFAHFYGSLAAQQEMIQALKNVKTGSSFFAIKFWDFYQWVQ